MRTSTFFLVAAAAVAAMVPVPSQAQSCQTVQLKADFVTGDLQGVAPADGVVCFDLRVPQGQNVSIELVSGRNVSVSAPGYFDARNDRMFLGDLPGQLEVRVFQLMRSASPEPFAVRIRFEAPGNG